MPLILNPLTSASTEVTWVHAHPELPLWNTSIIRYLGLLLACTLIAQMTWITRCAALRGDVFVYMEMNYYARLQTVAVSCFSVCLLICECSVAHDLNLYVGIREAEFALCTSCVMYLPSQVKLSLVLTKNTRKSIWLLSFGFLFPFFLSNPFSSQKCVLKTQKDIR